MPSIAENGFTRRLTTRSEIQSDEPAKAFNEFSASL